MPTTNVNILAVVVAAVATFLLGAVWYLVMAYVLALLASYTQATSLAQGLWLGFLAWLGFAATLGLTANMFSDKPVAVWVIDAGYQLAYLLVMGVIVSVWR